MPDIPYVKSEFFKALSHPLRIRALERLAEDERSVTALVAELGVEQPHLSQQLALLRRAGLVTTRREGSSVIYALADDRIAELLAVSKEILVDMHTATRDELRAS